MSKSVDVGEAINTLAYRIVGGVYPPGQLLPSVRQVAAEFDLSVPTANAVLRDVASSGLAEARQGLGYVVRDIRLYGGIETWQVIFKFSRQVPQLASKIFEDILQTEHMMLLQSFKIIMSTAADLTAVYAAVDRFEFLAGAPKLDLPELLRAELHILRMLAAACGQTVFLGIFNSVGEMLVQVREAADAVYVLPPADHVTAWRAASVHWGDTHPIDLSLIEQALDIYKAAVTDHFRTLLTSADNTSPVNAPIPNEETLRRTLDLFSVTMTGRG